MPYIHARCTGTVTEKQEATLRRLFGEAISLLPGKDERWLMIDIEDGARLSLGGKANRPLAMLEVELFGASTERAYADLTKRLTDILEHELAIPPEGVYVKYAEVGHWGFAGSNF